MGLKGQCHENFDNTKFLLIYSSSMHSPNNNLNLRIKTEPFTDGEDATGSVWHKSQIYPVLPASSGTYSVFMRK